MPTVVAVPVQVEPVKNSYVTVPPAFVKEPPAYSMSAASTTSAKIEPFMANPAPDQVFPSH